MDDTTISVVENTIVISTPQPPAQQVMTRQDLKNAIKTCDEVIEARSADKVHYQELLDMLPPEEPVE